MTDKVLEIRYQRALKRIGAARLLSLPEPIKTVLKDTTDLGVKVKMLELIAKNI